ncbi:MAG: NADH dehydrogenase subunit [Dethiosulfovibrio peptidovorans]|nr:MAG: NADH dehydrogenase subunit [Dethiosulfovibrio peptidovorans]
MSEKKTYKLPVGPVHVGLKEPITAWLDVEGESITNAVIRPGAIHRGVEFMARERNPIQVIYLSERVCGICSFAHAIAFVKAVEDAAQIPVPPRAQYIRSMVLELERIHSHILWSGVACYTIGFDSAFHLGMMLREKVMDVLEALTGNRVNYAVTTVGGVRWDVTPEVDRVVREMIRYYRNEFSSFYEAAIVDPVIRARLRNVGVLTTEEAIRYCALGPTARGSGVRCDIRWSAPYDAYCDIPVEPVMPQDYTGEPVHGDVFDRFVVRVFEVNQSLDILEDILDGLPEGDIAFEPKVNKLLSVLKKAGGVGYGCIEAPRGDDTHVVGLKEKQENVLWWKVRAPTYSNAVSWPLMFRNNELADAPLIINSIDPCISCMERMVLSDRGTGTNSVVTKADLLKLCREKTDSLRRQMA